MIGSTNYKLRVKVQPLFLGEKSPGQAQEQLKELMNGLSQREEERKLAEVYKSLNQIETKKEDKERVD